MLAATELRLTNISPTGQCYRLALREKRGHLWFQERGFLLENQRLQMTRDEQHVAQTRLAVIGTASDTHEHIARAAISIASHSELGGRFCAADVAAQLLQMQAASKDKKS
jgi:hypothetical protein